jgi:hypothetical protein
MFVFLEFPWRANCVFAATVREFLTSISLLDEFCGSVALGKPGGAQLSGNSEGIELVLAERRDDGFTQSFAGKEPNPIDELCQSLFARMTETVISHETEDWPGYYEKLCLVVRQVVARSGLSIEAKAVLTRRLIEHVVELEKWWPRLKSESLFLKRSSAPSSLARVAG